MANIKKAGKIFMITVLLYVVGAGSAHVMAQECHVSYYQMVYDEQKNAYASEAVVPEGAVDSFDSEQGLSSLPVLPGSSSSENGMQVVQIFNGWYLSEECSRNQKVTSIAPGGAADISLYADFVELNYKKFVGTTAGTSNVTIGFESVVGDVEYQWSQDGNAIAAAEETPSEIQVEVKIGLQKYQCHLSNYMGDTLGDVDFYVLGYDFSGLSLNKAVKFNKILGEDTNGEIASVSADSVKKYLSIKSKAGTVTLKKYCVNAPVKITLKDGTALTVSVTAEIPKPKLKISFNKGHTVLKIGYQNVTGASKVNFMMKRGKKFVKMNKRLGISTNPNKGASYDNKGKISKHDYKVQVFYKTNKGMKKVESAVIRK